MLSSTYFQHSFQHTLWFSTLFEIFNTFTTFPKIFNKCYSVQHMLKFSTCFFHLFSTCITVFSTCWNFQHTFQHSFQHALQFSTCAEIFNMLFSTCFQRFSTHIMVFNTWWNFQHTFLTCFQHISNIKIWNIYSQFVAKPIQKTVKS